MGGRVGCVYFPSEWDRDLPLSCFRKDQPDECERTRVPWHQRQRLLPPTTEALARLTIAYGCPRTPAIDEMYCSPSLQKDGKKGGADAASKRCLGGCERLLVLV